MIQLDRKYHTYKPYSLVGPTVTGQVQDLLAVLSLDNRLFMNGPLPEFSRN